MHVTMKLLENAMQAILKERTTGDGWKNGCGRFLVDGFPRKMDQAIGFDEQVGIIVICIGLLQLNSAIDLPIIARHLL
jgi:UMP-CMP kinase